MLLGKRGRRMIRFEVWAEVASIVLNEAPLSSLSIDADISRRACSNYID